MRSRRTPKAAIGSWRFGLAELVDSGMVMPATRRLSDVLAEHPPVKLGDAQATARALDEQRSDRA